MSSFREVLIDGLNASLDTQGIVCSVDVRKQAMDETITYAFDNYIVGEQETFFANSYNRQSFCARVWIQLTSRIKILSLEVKDENLE